MKLFRHHIGEYALDFATDSNPGIDVNASVSADGRTVYLHLVNTSRTSSVSVELDPAGKSVQSVTAYEIAHDPEEEITQMTPRLFDPVEKAVTGTIYTLPAAGVAALEIKLN